MKSVEIRFTGEDGGMRLDMALSRTIRTLSRNTLQKLIRSGNVTIDGTPVTAPDRTVSGGEILKVVYADDAPQTIPAAEPFLFNILYEDQHMLVIDKPANTVVHPAPGSPDGTVVNALMSRYPFLAEQCSELLNRPGIVHRLDKDTSGVLVIALTAQAQFKLASAFAEREVAKEYIALVAGTPPESSGRIETLIGRHKIHREKMTVLTRSGKEAVTCYEVAATGTVKGHRASLVKVRILTGRTHQIRVHMAHLRCPVIGDLLYGGRMAAAHGAPRQMLHAWKLTIPHPISGEKLTFSAPLPPDFKSILAEMVTL
jgi:23S rRNA pseudouridine1911/1915/1917 synthase